MSKRYGRFLASVVEGATAMQRPWRRAATRLQVAGALAQRHEVATPHGRLAFVTTHPFALEYPRELQAREPETLEWIDSFEAPAVFWDIGANIGAYTLYAALRPGTEVLAFEPAAANYAALCSNIEVNGLDGVAAAYCVALGERMQLAQLNMAGTHPGSVFNAFDSTVDCFGRPLDIAFRQAAVGFSVDGFRQLLDAPTPNYVKLDVDSIEEEILIGAAETLREPALRSVLVELTEDGSERNARIAAPLAAAGFSISHRGAPRGGVFNAVFRRAN
jgi:FkbM family methyltransferase